MKACGFNIPVLLSWAILLFVAHAFPDQKSYNPLSVTSGDAIRWMDLTVADSARKRDIPIRVYIPSGKSPGPVVLFSHGLGGSREGSAYLGKHWAGHGYWAVFLQHPGSDTSAWPARPPAAGWRP
jgi:predicted dienelactone hydrolase